MRLLPRTLFQRNLLLIVALILISQLSSAVLFRELVMKPRVRISADATAQDLLALVQGLQTLEPAQRSRFVERFNAHTRSQLSPPAAEEPGRSKRLAPLELAFVQEVSQRLGQQDGRLVWKRLGGNMLAVRLAVDDQSYWLELPALIPGREFSPTWVTGSAATALLALLGAWMIQRRINRPLNDLVQAARTLGAGGRPQALSESGPSEIATVAHSFNEMVDNLKRSEQERSLMLAGLSHDLRTPLAKMRLVSEMLEGAADAELLASLNRNIESMDALLGQFLDFTRASDEARWDQEPLSPCNLNDEVRAALPVHHPLRLADGSAPQGNGLDQARLVLATSLPTIMLRKQAVARLIANLMVNAERHGRPPIEVATGCDAQHVWLEVRDRGPGISPEQVNQLKQPFARGDSARGGPGGAGLGLAIVDRIANSHSASFDLLPREGGGLIARVQWPRSTPETPPL